MKLGELARRYDDELQTDAYAELDASANGLQVGQTDWPVDHVAVAVDAAQATIETAIDAGAEVLVVHHGLSWGGIERVTGLTYDRVKPLLEEDLGLYVSHLPLDGHPELGNAAGLADHLDVRERRSFASLGPETIGVRGQLPEPVSATHLADRLAQILETDGTGVQVLDHGPEPISDVAIVTGSGADFFEEAASADVDAFLTGEGKGKLYHEAREADVTAILAGHYATETFGVRNLADLANEWGLETTYISHPTGL